MKVTKGLTLKDALNILEARGWVRKYMDGRHERCVAPDGTRTLTIAASGHSGGKNGLAPNYLKSALRRYA